MSMMGPKHFCFKCGEEYKLIWEYVEGCLSMFNPKTAYLVEWNTEFNSIAITDLLLAIPSKSKNKGAEGPPERGGQMKARL